MCIRDRVIITGKNFNTYKHLQDTMEKKFDKLGKFFSDDITVNVVLSQERGKDKIEATINAKGAVFRAEEVVPDIYEGIDLSLIHIYRMLSVVGHLVRHHTGIDSDLHFRAKICTQIPVYQERCKRSKTGKPGL